MPGFLRYLRLLRSFFFFSALLSVCLFLMLKEESYLSARWFRRVNEGMGEIHQYFHGLQEYFHLSQVNTQLVEENTQLRHQLWTHQLSSEDLPRTASLSSQWAIEHEYLPAHVVKNTLFFQHNYIVLNKGYRSGIREGMGVVGQRGVVGKVKHVSESFSTLYSLLHTDLMISCRIARDSTLATLKWDGISPQNANLLYVPRHVFLKKGDLLLSSGGGNTFPYGVPLGLIDSFDLKEHEVFYRVKVSLATDFYRLHNVYVVLNPRRRERDSLEFMMEQTLGI
ncbi:MAG: rod shape-determining protein MreC [Cytophagales bacterium]|nr:rod shape-determining protein MreC [Cytophagales bacterium]